jgi:hypothetical protein
MALLVLGGCGAPTARLSGKVLWQGKPVPGTEIELTPLNDTSKNFRGIGLADGTYQLDYGAGKGLPVGKYRAKVTFYAQADGQPLPAGEEGAALKNSGQALPQHYLLELDVTKGSQTVDLNLDQAKLAESDVSR